MRRLLSYATIRTIASGQALSLCCCLVVFMLRVGGAFLANNAIAADCCELHLGGSRSSAAKGDIHSATRTRNKVGCPQSSLWRLRLSYERASTASTAAGIGAVAPPTAAIKPGLLGSLKEGARRDDEPQVLYFAFGANMNPSVLTVRRGVRPIASLPVEAIALSTTWGRKTTSSSSRPLRAEDRDGGICLCFCHRAGYATLEQAPGPPQSWKMSPGVHGVLHLISQSDMTRIASFETGYKKCVVEVETISGERDQAICFVSNPMQVLPTSVPPTSRYLSLLQDGACHHGVNESYQSWLASLPSVPSRQAEASPERINTPSKVLANNVLTLLAVLAAVGASTSFRGVLDNQFDLSAPLSF